MLMTWCCCQRVANSLTKLSPYCDEWGLQINISKTKSLVFNTTGRTTSHKFYINIENCRNYVYLEVTVSISGSLTEAKNNLYHKGLKALFKVKTCFPGHSPKIKAILHIFDHTIKPILLYGSEIWGSFPATKLLTEGDNYFSNVCRDLIAEKGDFKLCKYSIKVGKKAPNSAVMGELGRYPLFQEVLLNMKKYWVRLSKINNSSTLLSECLLLSEALHKQNKKSWYASIDTILRNLNVSAKSILTTKRNIKSYFYSKLKPKYKAALKTDFVNDRPGKQYGNKLRTYRLFKNNFAFESYLDLDNFNRNIWIRFRISAHNLEIEKWRHQNIPLNERI